ncbi:hypothetical protein N7468_009369 [Penicillium chermesinum]|uniref:Mediator of RNA polymerase II transcription subunit 31 n=1 Tax=Penicillium chermesinum TaxID=63820 RepID=A0A9W9NHP6_9EURO|nr:uncharacterized protein N7468_009369 [Penicillium chermesinum]KAJ5220165.1 hypothetical protein N7468_009369 [Penicillium chermesinum]
MEPTQPPPTLTNPRFTLELEFVSSLANPYYLSHLAVTYPNLLGISRADDDDDSASSPDAQAFAAYLAYPLFILENARILPVIDGLAGVVATDNAVATESEAAGPAEKQNEENGVKT